MVFVFPTYLCWSPAFLEVDKHLPVMGHGELISYFALFAQSKLFSLFPFWFSPSSPCRAASVHIWGNLPAEVQLPQQPCVCLAFITTRVQSWLMLIGSRYTPRTFSAALFPAHQPQHWCWGSFISGWTSHLSLLNFQGIYCLIFTSLLATMTSNTSLQYTSSICGHPWTCWGSQMWVPELLEQASQRGCDISAKTESFQLLTGKAPQQTDLTSKLNVILI